MEKDASTDDHGEELVPRQQSLLRSSLLMASGTLLSRLLGFVRNAMLIAAIGVSLGAADAFGAANMLPNSVYNLLAAGIFDAILIPQIVRALKQKNGTVYVNRLLTAAGTILFGITVLAMIGAPLLITITSSGFPPETRSLAIAFAIWCLPQIFFYGLYNLLGEVLNARGIFGPYMWAPVVNNIVAISGLGVFLYIWGPSGKVFPAAEFSQAQMIVLAGTATLGVILQALILLIPMRSSGVKLRLDFKFRETNFGSASKVAGWTFATLLVSQLGVLSTSNLASRAVGWAEENNTVVASLPAYNTAFMVYMVPQALIALTLATAIFTRLANNVSDGDYVAVAKNYTLGTRLIVLLSMLAVAIFIVGAVPLMQLIMPTFEAAEASLYASVLIALILGVPSTGIVMISQRVFFALENAKPVFLMGIVPTILQLIIGWGIFFTMDAQWWTVGAAIGETACRVLQGFIAIFWTAYAVRTINAGRIVAYYVRYLTAAIVSALVGWGVLHLVGPGSTSPSTMGRFFDAFWKLGLVTIVITAVYLLVLHYVDKDGTAMLGRYLGERVPRRLLPTFLGAAPQTDEEDAADSPVPELALLALPLGSIPSVGKPGDSCAVISMPKPSWDQIVDGDLASRSLTRSLGGVPDTLTGQVPVVTMSTGSTVRGKSEKPQTKHTPDGILLGTESSLPSGIVADEQHSPPLSPGEEISTPVGGEDISRTPRTKYFDALLSGEDPLETPSAPTPVMHYPHVEANSIPPQPSAPKPASNEPPRILTFSATTAGPKKGGTMRFNPTLPAMVLGALALVFGMVFAFGQLKKPIEVDFLTELAEHAEETEVAQSEAEAVAAEEKAKEEAEVEPEPDPPVISSIWVYSWNDDGMDHPELVDLLVDGDKETLWYSRYYDVNEFPEDSTISLLVNLEKTALVSEVILDVQGSGGEVVIREPDGENPRSGDVLATSTMDGKTTIKLPKATNLSRVGISFNQLPTDYEGLYRAQIAELTIK